MQIDEFKVLNWNIAGAKYLEKTEDKREIFKNDLEKKLKSHLTNNKPDIVTLQEIVQYKMKDNDEWNQIISDFPEEINEETRKVKFPGYIYLPFPLISSDSLSIQAKWNKIRDLWPPGTNFAQGNGFLIRKDRILQPVWDLPIETNKIRDSEKLATYDDEYRKKVSSYIEKVSLETGLYFGDRDTEPRAALVAHFVLNPTDDKKPLDIFVINLHLTTLTHEREGIPKIDTEATKIRLQQLEIVFNGVISRYNSWRRSEYLERGKERKEEDWETFNRHEPLWIIAGDFNATPEDPKSHEYKYMEEMNFMDMIPLDKKGDGTKAAGVGKDPTLTLDYIFAGPKFLALHSMFKDWNPKKCKILQKGVSDHLPMIASIPYLSLKEDEE